jgi:hypothetical protein
VISLADTARAAIAALDLPPDKAAAPLRRIGEIEGAYELGGAEHEARDALAQVVIQAGGGDPWRAP